MSAVASGPVGLAEARVSRLMGIGRERGARGMRWLWPGAGVRAASVYGGWEVIAEGATPAVPGRFGALHATRVEAGTANLSVNPSVEVNTSGYAASGAGSVSVARTTARAVFGVASVRAACDGTGNRQGWRTPGGALGMPVAASTTYTVSGYVVGDAVKPLLWSLIWADAGGTFVRQDDSADITLGTAAFARTAYTVTSPADAAYLEVRLRASGFHAVTFDADGVQVEAAASASSYCDGSLSAGYAWSGTAHASTSTRAAGRVRAEMVGCSAVRFGAALWWRPDRAADALGDHTLLRWQEGDAYIDVTYRAAGDRFRLTVQAAAGSADVVESAVQAFAAGDDVLIVVGADAHAIRIAVGEGAYAIASRGAVAGIDARLCDLGSDGASGYAGGGLGPVGWFARPLDSDAVRVLARLVRAPGWREVG